MRHLRVDDVMTRRVATVQVGTPFKDVARLLAERKVSAVPVLDSDGRLAGIVSEADLLRKEQYQENATPGAGSDPAASEYCGPGLWATLPVMS
jgi:CBS domain-containing protein